MKTKQFFLVIVAIAFAANVFATDIPKMSIAPMKDAKTLISIAHTLPEFCEVSIRNQSGEMMYYSKTKKKVDCYKKILNLSQLADGNYRLTVNSGNSTIKNVLKIDNGIVSVENTRNEMKPYFTANKENVLLSYLNFYEEEMTVRVYDSKACVFSKKLGTDLAMHRVINLKKLNSGNYDILLSDKHNQYWFSFSK